MRISKKRLNVKVIIDYDKLVDKKEIVDLKITSLQREKDYVLTKIANKYDQKITDAFRELDAINGLIKASKEYVSKN